jgi:predicted RNase H-like nuclease
MRPAVAAIDIPVGLEDRGARACDVEARRILGKPRSSSVFPAPVRPVLSARSYGEARRIGLSLEGRKPTLQCWGIVPKIVEVDAFLRAHRRLRSVVYEVHPELSFHAWAGDRAVLPGKKTVPGRAIREQLVRSRFGRELDAAIAALPRSGWGIDDLLDAFAALWTAQRISAGSAVTIPSPVPVDRFGLRMAISY